MQDDDNKIPVVTAEPSAPAEQPVNQSAEPVQPIQAQPTPMPVQAADPASVTDQTMPQPKPETSSTPPAKQKKEGGVLSFIVTLIVAFLLVQVINLFFFQSYKVFGSSMYSTLHDGDRLIISKVGKTTARATGHNYTPKRGEIIVFIDPQNPNIQLIKRVIGLPGERVVVKDGKITVYNQENPNGFNPDENKEYSKNLPDYTTGDKDIVVPKDQIFVSGDNRTGSNSLDSRNELGTVPEKDIVGTLKVRIFPVNTAQFF